MPIALSNLMVIANATINPSTIVMIDSSRDNAVIPAVNCAVKSPIAVAQPGTEVAPNAIAALGGTGPSPQPAAVQGDQVSLFFTGDVCDVLVGSAAVTAGDLLMPDGNSAAITATSGHFTIGYALQSGAPGVLIRMVVDPGKI